LRVITIKVRMAAATANCTTRQEVWYLGISAAATAFVDTEHEPSLLEEACMAAATVNCCSNRTCTAVVCLV
jgi:hypothetical protein